MDIPLFKDLNEKSRVDTRTPRGTVTLYFPTGKHGSKGPHSLTIIGSARDQVMAMESAFVTFRGVEYAGTFTTAKPDRGLWSVSFETDIPAPEFWVK